MPEMGYLTTGQAADALQTSRDTIRRLVKAGELKGVRLRNDGYFRIHESDLRQFAEQRGIVLTLDTQSAK